MTEIIGYLLSGTVIGICLGWVTAKLIISKAVNQQKEENNKQFAALDKEFAAFKTASDLTTKDLQDDLSEKKSGLIEVKKALDESEKIILNFEKAHATLNANNNSLQEALDEKIDKIKDLEDKVVVKINENKELTETLATKTANLKATNNSTTKLEKDFADVKEELSNLKTKFNTTNENLATANAENKALADKLVREQQEIKELRTQFNTEFQNIASKILKDNTKSFSELNESKIKELLNPLNKDINEFKSKVEDVYSKESKERFSLGEKVKELAAKSAQISQDAINLTNALKGEAKTQGNWGEMILESILEKSGLRKDQEYFMEHQLRDENGKALRSDSENKKMRPDAVIKYPDNRNVIIDSKVSLNAFTRYLAADNLKEQKREIEAHVTAIKNHIIALSAKGYDDYNKALDFVMMFIPSEPAYIAAMQADANLWNFAYDKRILLMNPTNLITSLKLIVDLWKREYQNQNAVEIAERGAKLYDKFVGFTENLEKVGTHLERAQSSYQESYKQLSTGNDNLVLQATKLKKLGVKNKKKLAIELENDASVNVLTE